VAGYRKASDRLEELLPTLVHYEMKDGRDRDELIKVISPVVAAKQYGSEKILAPLIADACIGTVSTSGKPTIDPESIRISKILGGSVSQSSVINGFVSLRGAETSITDVTDAKITVFGCGVEASTTEAKGTVLMKDADDLKGYNKTEEKKMEEIIKSVADTGTKVVVSGSTVSEMAMHFIERYGMMCIRIGSKWELRRLCSATGCTALVRLGPATPDEIGFANSVKVTEVGGRKVTIFSSDEDSNDGKGCRLSTVLLRAATSNLLQDLERAADDGVRAAQTACKDPRFVPGAGATEMELSTKIRAYADTCPGLDQYAIRSFAAALEFVPRTLAENAGLDGQAVLATLSAAHTADGDARAGVDIEAADKKGSTGIRDCGDVLDLLATKVSAFRLAIDAALTVLRVDQIIMAKQAGGGQKDARMGPV